MLLARIPGLRYRSGWREALGYEHVVVLGHPEYYPRFGFRPGSGKGIQAPFSASDEAFMVLEIKPGSLTVHKRDGSVSVCF